VLVELRLHKSPALDKDETPTALVYRQACSGLVVGRLLGVETCLLAASQTIFVLLSLDGFKSYNFYMELVEV